MKLGRSRREGPRPRRDSDCKIYYLAVSVIHVQRCFFAYKIYSILDVPVAVTVIVVNLRNRTGEERRRQTLCDKRDNNFA